MSIGQLQRSSTGDHGGAGGGGGGRQGGCAEIVSVKFCNRLRPRRPFGDKWRWKIKIVDEE